MIRQRKTRWWPWLGLLLALAAAGAAQAGGKKARSKKKDEPATAESLQSTAPGILPGQYVIGPTDVLAIDVWRDPEVSQVEEVLPNGRITLPLIGEIQASGKTPERLQSEIERKLSAYIHDPSVTVIVRQANSMRFNIIGQVERPGSYSLGSQMTVLDAIAVAGGFQEFAKTAHIYVIRQERNGSMERIRFNYKKAVHGNKRFLDLKLKPGDTVIVP